MTNDKATASTKDAALKLALEIALEKEYQLRKTGQSHMIEPVIIAIKEALAPTSTQCEVQPEQEPVAFGMLRADGLILDVICPDEHESFAGEYTIPLYTTPPKRPWVGLTDVKRDEILDIYLTAEGRARAIEAELKELNT